MYPNIPSTTGWNNSIAKLPESCVLGDNITEFGVAEDHLSPQAQIRLGF